MARYFEDSMKVNGSEVSFIRIDNDFYGNPRYVVHFLSIADDYAEALKIARTVGGQKYRAKWYGGGIVLQSYNIRADLERIVNGGKHLKTTFEELGKGEYFVCNETVYQKKSSRTAYLVGRGHQWFYFKKGEQITNAHELLKPYQY